MKIYLATKNEHKVKEFQSFSNDEFEFLLAKKSIEVDEIYDSFLENAYLKAKAFALETGEISMSDDSGLVVPSLAGDPGVFSARYNSLDNFIKNEEIAADRANNLKLLSKMEGITDRQAIFVCVVVLVFPQLPNLPVIAQGLCEGEIIDKKASELAPHKGFGYDMLFVPKDFDRDFASITLEEKNSISHRGKAIRNLIRVLQD